MKRKPIRATPNDDGEDSPDFDGSFNHLDIAAFVAFLQSLPLTDGCQLFVKEQFGSGFVDRLNGDA